MSPGGSDGGVADAGFADGGPSCSVAASWTSIHDNLLSVRCRNVTCHSTFALTGGLDYGSGRNSVYNQLVNGDTYTPEGAALYPKRVVPGDPGSSFLYVKISDVNAPGRTGQMPPEGPPLPECAKDAIRAWIQSGAPMN